MCRRTFPFRRLLYAGQIRRRHRATTSVQKMNAFFRRNAFALLASQAVLVVAGLAVRNISGMWFTRGTSLKNCGELLANSLPTEGGIVLANDALLMTTLQATLARRPNATFKPMNNTPSTFLKDLCYRTSDRYCGCIEYHLDEHHCQASWLNRSKLRRE